MIGQFVAPKLRTRWTLALGNTVENLQGILAQGPATDLFFYDNGPDVNRARIELRSAWNGLSERGVLLAHHIDLNPAFEEFCQAQGIPAAPPFDGRAPSDGRDQHAQRRRGRGLTLELFDQVLDPGKDQPL